MIPMGTGPETEPIEPPIILEEPKLPWRLSGWLLIIFGVLDTAFWVNTGARSTFDPAFIWGVIICLTLMLGGVFILRRERRASWVVVGVLVLNILIVPFLVQEGHSILGDTPTLAVGGSVFLGLICGGIALIPIIFGLKKGEEGRF